MYPARQPTFEVRRVKAAVLERDGYKCVRCGVSSGQYKAVYGRQLDVRRRESDSPFTVDGCVTLCAGCGAHLCRRAGTGPPRKRKGMR